ncbi:hypothetical protein [Fimbriiglobus ruber]|uniref:Uncharacterized protein n=1 Tax=Fimbriiglobus ruber TaxID=1908690 RepID=A0A225DEF7_9BACT|nr:hypothetical protein [Fimbriiglobus ruber]OWK35539.1 hypothetical protein FRUB_08102 [Fimbriiglobus ruber]
MADDDFLAAFVSCMLPRADWTHAAHVRMAWLYLTRLPFDQALDRARTGIQRYNASLGNAAGYHDTVTVAFVRVIAARMSAGAETFSAFRDRNPDLFDRTGAVLQTHYSQSLLDSEEARRQFVPPDREPLPAEPRGA